MGNSFVGAFIGERRMGGGFSICMQWEVRRRNDKHVAAGEFSGNVAFDG